MKDAKKGQLHRRRAIPVMSKELNFEATGEDWENFLTRSGIPPLKPSEVEKAAGLAMDVALKLSEVTPHTAHPAITLKDGTKICIMCGGLFTPGTEVVGCSPTPKEALFPEDKHWK
tara:strand:+ start:11430 stop:11777 length:348 start_codon:yes stop_codon:yes gene_type:complete